MLNFQTWLENTGVVRIALVQAQCLVSGVLTTRYLSTHNATVGGIEYLPIISGKITINENISTEYSASISYGDIELVNSNGLYDTWLNNVWVNKNIKVYVGSLPLPGSSPVLTDFELVFDGVISNIDTKSNNRLNLVIRDKLENINTSISEILLGNYWQGGIVSEATYVNQYRNNLKPIVYGEVHNITPLLIDPPRLEYMVNFEAVEQIIEVRDNGVPVAFTTGTSPAGCFKLVASPAGTITCSIQGVAKTINISGGTTTNVYLNTASNTIATILKLMGKQLNYTDIDSVSFSALGPQAIGIYITDRENVLTLCQSIAKSCGLILSITRLGKVKLINLAIPGSASVTITESDMMLNSLSISRTLDIIAGVKFGYAKNWTIQEGLITSIPEEHKKLFATEWLESIQKDATVKTNYGISVEPVLEDTVLIDKIETDAVALKVLNLFKVPRKILSMECTSKLLSVEVGTAVTVVANRFGLAAGVIGLVISASPDWLTGKIALEVLI
jgi:hypothetical protein